MSPVEFNPRQLASNEALLAYVAWLEDRLRVGEELHLASVVERSIGFAGGSPSEFLHEVDCALRMVAGQTHVLSEQEQRDISAVIDQIERAFRSIGGA